MNPSRLSASVLPPAVAAKSPTPAGRTADPVAGGDDSPSFDKVMNGVANRSRTERDKPTEDNPPATSASDTTAAPPAPATGETQPATEASTPPTEPTTEPAHPPGWLVAMAHGAGQQSAAVAASGNPVLTSGQRGGLHTVMDAATPATEGNDPLATGLPGAKDRSDPAPMGRALGLDADSKAALPPGVMAALAQGAKADTAAASLDTDKSPRPAALGARSATLPLDTPLARAPGNAAATPAVLDSAAFAAVLDKEHPGAHNAALPLDTPLARAPGNAAATPAVLNSAAFAAVLDKEHPGTRSAILPLDTPLDSAPGNAAATPAVLNSAAFAAVLDKEHPGARSDKDSPPGLINGIGSHTPTVALADGEAGTVYRSTLQSHPSSAAFPAELASEVRLLMKNGLQQAELRLNPTDLGPIRIDLTLTGQTADIAFSAAHAATREGIQQSLAELRDMLGSQGIGLGQTQVGADTPQQQATQRDAGQQAPSAQAAASARLGAVGLRTANTGAEPPRVARPRGVLDMYA